MQGMVSNPTGDRQQGIPQTSAEPELRLFDAAGCDDDDGAQSGLWFPEDFGRHDPDDTPPAAPSAALTIRLAGAGEVRPGYDAWAVQIGVGDDGEEEVLAGQPLTNGHVRLAAASLACTAHAIDRSQLRIAATHCVVNDHTGREVRRVPLLNAA